MARQLTRIMILLAVGLGAGAAAAGTPGGNVAGELMRAELEVLGQAASRTWQAPVSARAFDQIGGEGMDDPPDEVGGAGGDTEREQEPAGPSNLGDKVKAGALSAVLPGAGQFYNGQRTKAYIMAGAEAAIWTAWFVFDQQGDNRMESSREWSAIYAGTRGEHEDRWWQSVGKYMDSEAWYEDLLREARALREDPPPMPVGDETWQWVNDDRRIGYQKLRADANSAYDRRDFMILFAVINRAVSVVDAVIGAGAKPGTLETEVLGMDMELGVVPSWRDPGARWTLSRSF